MKQNIYCWILLIKQAGKSMDSEVILYTYILNIQSIKMKVKFPCKMKLEYNGQVLTTEVSPNDMNKFIFNQQVTVTEEFGKTYFELVAHLITDKGGKYFAGVVKLDYKQLNNQEGELLIVPLVKWLDPEATCELRVDQVLSEKVNKPAGFDKGVRRDYSPHLNPKGYNSKNQFATKSEYQFPIKSNKQHHNWAKDEGNISNYQKTRSPHHYKKSNIGGTYLERNIHQGPLDSFNRDKLIEAEVYKQSYQKLKQKYKKQAEAAKNELNKRIALENSQNNYRLQIMRLKLKNEQQDKAINDKNNRIKELQIQVGAFQKKEMDLAYFKQESENKDYTLRMLEETIKTLNRDNEDLKALNRERFEGEQQKIKQLRNQLDRVKHKFDSKETDLEKEIRSKSDIILQKESQLRMKDDRLERQQKLVDDLQKSGQMKMLEFQKTIQSERSQWKSKIQDLKMIIERLQREKSKLQQESKEFKNETEKIKSYMIKVQYDKKVLNQESDSFKHELSQLKVLKQKYQQLSREHRLLVEDKGQMQRQLEKSLQTKDSNIQELSKQHHEQLEHYKKSYRQIQQKFRSYQSKNLELESQLEQRKNQLQKNKRNYENINKQLAQEKDKEKSLRKSLKSKDQQLSTVSGEFQAFKQRFRSSDQITKLQIDNLSEELQRSKRELENEYSKNIQLTEKLSRFNEETMIIRLKLQQSEDNTEKNNSILKDKQSSLDAQIRQRDRKLEENQNVIQNLRKIEKQQMEKLQNYELSSLKTSEKITSLEKSMKGSQEQNVSFQNSLKIKQRQLQTLTKTKQQLQQRVTNLQEKLSNTKNACNVVTGQKNKNDKIIELLNKDIADLKQQNTKLNGLISDKEKNIQEMRNQIKKNKEDILKIQMKNTNLKKQYDRFKQQLNQTLISSFSQLPQPSSIMHSDLKSSNVSDVLYRRQNPSEGLNNVDIVNRITSQNKQIKISLTKVIEQNKMLKSQSQKLNEQILNYQSKSEMNRSELQKIIQNLEEELSKISSAKQQNQICYVDKINQLNQELDRKQKQTQQLTAQLQELNFSINSLKMDNQANGEHFVLKQSQYKSKITELQEKISYLTRTVQDYEVIHQELQSKISQNNMLIESQRDNIIKREKIIEQLQKERKVLTGSLEDGKKQRKQLLEKISELQLRLNAETQINTKYKQQLQDQQHKNSELKQFVANLMKQKQSAIKSDLEKSQQIIKLQMNISELTRDKQMQYQQIVRMKKSIQEHKQNVRKLTHQIKQLDSFGTDQKGKLHKTVQKLRQTERNLKNTQQQFDSIQKQHQRFISKSNNQISELQQALEDKNKNIDQLTNQFEIRTSQWQKNILQSTTKIDSLNKKITQLQEQLFVSKQNHEEKVESSESLFSQLKDTKNRLKSLNQTINQLNEQIKEKQESMFQFSGKIYNLEVLLENKEAQKIQTIENMSEEWETKYDDMCNEHEERMKLVEKERDHLKERIKQLQEEHRKAIAELRSLELDDNNFKKILEDKIKRLEQDRLSVISSKNNEIQRVSEESKMHFEALKTKQADLRRLQHQLQVARSSIAKLDLNKRETQEKIRNINKVYHGELQQLKRKQASNRVSKQSLNRVQWDLEREVKKLIQNLVRKSISGQSKQSSQKLVQLLRSFEEQITNLLNTKLEDAK